MAAADLRQPLIALLADGHLTADDGERLRGLAASLDALPREVVGLYILGDLFEVWLGVAARQPHVEAVAEALRRLRGRGVRVGYVEGNRDFRIARGPHRDLFDVASPALLVERFGERTYHLAHGDLVNRADRQYRAWRAFAKRLLAPAALNLLPPRACLGLGRSLERRLRRTNPRHKAYFPRAACEDYVRRAMEAGADVVVVGHFHLWERFELEHRGRRGLFVSLPFWHQEPRFVLFDRQGSVSELEASQGLGCRQH